MPKKIIILDIRPGHQTTAQQSATLVRAVFWFAVTTVVADETARSAYSGITQQEFEALRAGTVKEEVVSLPFSPGTSTTAIKAKLLSEYTARQTFLASQPQPGIMFGLFYDGTVWSG